MISATASQLNLNKITNEMDKISEEIKQGKWNNKKDQLNEKLNELLKELLREAPSKGGVAKAAKFVAKLGEALERSPVKTAKVRKFIESFKKIKEEISDKDFVPEIAKHLKADTRKDFNESLQFLTNSMKSPESLARWISYQQIPLKNLNLSSRQLEEIAPYLEFLDFRNAGLSEKEIKSIVERAPNLEKLILDNTDITSLPELPENLKELSVCNCPNLTQIDKLNKNLEKLECTNNDNLESINSFENLRSIDCSYNTKLSHLPKKSEAVEFFSCKSCPILTELPKFGRSLRDLDSSDCPNIKSINLGEGVVRFTCNRCNFDTFPTLPKTLESLECMENHNLTSLKHLPANLKVVNVSYCSNLKEIDLPKNLEEIHKVGTDVKFKKPENLKVYS